MWVGFICGQSLQFVITIKFLQEGFSLIPAEAHSWWWFDEVRISECLCRETKLDSARVLERGGEMGEKPEVLEAVLKETVDLVLDLKLLKLSMVVMSIWFAFCCFNGSS